MGLARAESASVYRIAEQPGDTDRRGEGSQMRKTLFFDTETTGVDKLYNQTPREQFKLGQYAWGMDGDIVLTEDYDEMLSVMNEADLLVGHNVFYDLTVMYGKDSMRPLELALQNRVLCTFWWYPLRNRVPVMYETVAGRKATTYSDGKQKPELVKRFLALGNLTHHHGLPGKVGELSEIAKRYNPKGTLKENLDYGLIDVKDPEFREYAYNDIVALRALAKFLIDQGNITDYEWREMLKAAINNQMSKNGIKVDEVLAGARVQELEDEKNEVMDWLIKTFDFPTVGANPWKSDLGKAAILKAFETFGITPDGNDNWTKTPAGAPSFSSKVLVPLTEGTPAEKLGRALGTLQSQRSLAAQALESRWDDGYAHPEMTALQRSGRFSMTKPSLPIWTARGDNSVEKAYFVASPGRKLVEADFSNADQRIVAALSGDPEYIKRFQPDPLTGVTPDGHELSGRLMFGDAEYDKDPKGNRNIAKALSHAFAYGAGAKTLARTSKLPPSDDPSRDPLRLAYKFIDAMNAAYPWNKIWRENAAEAGKKGYLISEWGRKMFVDVERSWTQSPGLLGQNGTLELLCDGLIAIAKDRIEVLRYFVASVHDAVLWDIPEDELDELVPYIKEKMETTFCPSGAIGQPVEFPLTFGKPADNWFLAGH